MCKYSSQSQRLSWRVAGRAGGCCASRWLNSFDLKEKRVDINPSIATGYFLRVKGSIDFLK